MQFKVGTVVKVHVQVKYVANKGVVSKVSYKAKGRLSSIPTWATIAFKCNHMITFTQHCANIKLRNYIFFPPVYSHPTRST